MTHRRPISLLIILLLFTAAYVARATVLPVFGEETRRGLVAREMIETGDWIVPRVQGEPQLSRPPLQNWLIAGAAHWTGRIDVWAIRLPSLLMTLATVALIYGFTLRVADDSTALLSAMVYLTMHEVLEYGRSGETEAIFTGFVAGSLIVWQWGQISQWNSYVTWSACYSLVAAGMLTKGPQAPLYFCGAVALTLWQQRRWRELLSWPHLAGCGTFALIVGSWQLAFIDRLGAREGWLIHWLNISYRFTDRTNDPFLEHLLTFPLEVWGVMLPGSFLLLPLCSQTVRQRLGKRGAEGGGAETIRFLVTAIAWAFIFVWIPPGAKARYFMPLMPLVAILCGLVGSVWLAGPWRGWSPQSRYRLTVSFGILFAVAHAGPVLSLQARYCDDIAGQVARLKAELPLGEDLVSLETLHHGFLYYFGEPIRKYPLPQRADELPHDCRYFAIHTHDAEPPELPFEWEEIAVVTCDRYRREPPQVRIHVGRRKAEDQKMAERSGL